MDNPFAGPVGKRVVLVVLLLATVAIITQASEMWFANYLADSGKPSRIERAAALFPGDADFWDRLGRYYFLNFADPNIPLAIASYQKAVSVDPLSEHYWMDLANAYESVGNTAGAQEAFEHARAVYPTSAEVAWNYGNFLLRENNPAGYGEVQRAIRGDPSLLPLALSRMWRSSGDVDQLLKEVIPGNTQSYLAALDFFASIQDAAPGMVVWQKLMKQREPFSLRRTFPFLEELIREDDSPDASRVWSGAVDATNNRSLRPVGANLVSDGDFQGGFANGGLGWRWDSTPSTAIDFDSGPPGVTGRSVRLEFGGGANVRLQHPSQFIAIEPNKTYRFRAQIRTEDISTDSGVRFNLADPHHPDVPAVTTANLIGSHPWESVEADFVAGPQTHFVLFGLRRDPSQFFENRLSGTAWIANISLVEAPSSAGHPTR